ncbi:phosphate acetyltransferase [Tessaracoccus aquimaris]|uniref:Phosphate acetyltransferase n=1 Tax=Tessaracoccus aquimaris TaxID=1332264 RepID=A0A1Q2CN12_9ACTN|nr:phosphate acetyltransferase [Tessaracoccus aquimaris]AQP47450.1 phosphate acetyltransferase [Tessaracoccus aquimaris]
MAVRSLYLCPTQHCPHLLQFAVGAIAGLRAEGARVTVFRPIVADSRGDRLLKALSEPTEPPAWGATADQLLNTPGDALGQIIARFATRLQGHTAAVVLGSEYDCSLAPVEFAWNTKVAANLDVPMLLVVPADGGADLVRERIAVALDEATRNLAQVLGIIVPSGRQAPLVLEEVARDCPVPVHLVREVEGDAAPDLAAVAAGLGAEQLAGGIALSAQSFASPPLVADMSLTHLLPLIDKETIAIFSADRAEIAVGLCVAGASGRFSFPAAAIAAGPWPLERGVADLWRRVAPSVPLLRTPVGVREVSRLLEADALPVAELAEAHRAEAIRNFSAAVDLSRLGGAATIGRDDVVTPMMFEHRLLEAARAADRHIVLPEGEEDRILRAAHRLLEQGICRLTLLGNVETIRGRAAELGVDIAGAQLIDPRRSELLEPFAARYAELRKKKGVTLEQARQRVMDVSYFGTMMVLESLADGMVSGSVNTTAHTIRPALEVIRTRPGISVVSSVFFMCLADRVLVFGDCAVNPNPTPDQLAEIALSSAATARQFGIDPRIAMLSYSTGSSGSGPDVEATVEATRLLREMAPELPVDGPLQYDAAVEPSVALTKLPGSPVAGRATILIFPDLQTGNNTYKAVQRSAGALAIGPVLQGLNKPVNDLSRGALVSDIVNTVAITAIQAGTEEP